MSRSLFLLVGAILLLVIAVVTVPSLVVARDRAAVVWTAALLAAALALTAAASLARNLARPLRELADALRRIGAGDFDARVMPGRRGELRELGRGFNDMAGRTRQLVDDLKRQRAALNAIIASIREGLAVLSPDGRVTLANASFRQLTGNQDPAGRYYWELLREAGFVELVKDAGGSAATVGAIVELASRTYAGSATRLPETGETVVTLHDVTDIANSEKMKRELVLNVSHELRTPLTAIRGYLETMEPEVSEPNRGYLQIVRRHTDRLTRLVQDLIT
ncbi:HAMP domain-containing protein, partial [candidate division WOR-3 bacterium]|nr:HAMP domain-containing protein [candidate division WOR-3 bacterium]